MMLLLMQSAPVHVHDLTETKTKSVHARDTVRSTTGHATIIQKSQ